MQVPAQPTDQTGSLCYKGFPVVDQQPKLTLWRWTERGSEQVDDPAEIERMARRLRSAWIAANGKEKAPGKNTGRKPQLTPEQEAEMRALGYL